MLRLTSGYVILCLQFCSHDVIPGSFVHGMSDVGPHVGVHLAQPDLSGNSFGNKGSFVTLGFRKYLRKFAYASQKVAIALDRNKLSVACWAMIVWQWRCSAWAGTAAMLAMPPTMMIGR